MLDKKYKGDLREQGGPSESDIVSDNKHYLGSRFSEAQNEKSQ